MRELITLILAAGHGKRMKSKKHKVLHEVCGKPMLGHVIDLARDIESSQIICVIGHEKDQLIPLLDQLDVKWVEQAEQLGTGHAVKMAESYFGSDKVLVLYGDTPLIDRETMEDFLAYHETHDHAGSLISCVHDNPMGYGRIVRDPEGRFQKIVEQKEASPEVLKINEVNSGICLFKANLLAETLEMLKNDNAQGEYYLTDVFEHLIKSGHEVGAFISEKQEVLLGVNNRVQLWEAEKFLQSQIIKNHQLNGVTFISPDNTVVEKDVMIGMDTVVYPGSVLKGRTVIGEDCVIGPNADISDTQIENGVSVIHSKLIESKVGSKTQVGPYAYLRPKSNIGKNVKIGDFVEIKNSRIGDDTKISHLTYVGDGIVGQRVNIGCGVVFVNYDGKNKYVSEIEDDAFVGCNVNLISPVKIGKGAYIAAGSTINKDVPDQNLGIARARQENKTNWSSKYQK